MSIRSLTQEDPIGLAGGLNLYGFSSGDPVNYSDPFGLCPGIEGTDPNNLDDCPDESTRSFWDRFWNGPRYIEQGGKRYRLIADEFPNVGPGGAERMLARSSAFLERVGTKLVNQLGKVDPEHLSAAAREIAGEISRFDHVTEVQDPLNGLRKTARRLTGFLNNPRITGAMKQLAEDFRRQALEAIRRGEEALRSR